MHLERRAMLVILHYEYFFSSGEGSVVYSLHMC